eukprot:TRINITY_DN4567_c1_g2_i1.p1 TRINITY_DN4567_c1_g2~~TRINITY_DN4567_c1_g2_i1.p1  ORF type:complete len:652 (+),score=137.75 TRINITY_DN4567_c1_g2_i1:82-2037(+)
MFRQSYVATCHQMGIDPMPSIESIELPGEKLCVTSQTLAVKGSLALGEALRCSEFKEVELCNSYINDEGCRALCEGLIKNTFLMRLNLSGNNFGSASSDSLAAVVRCCPNLTELILEWNGMGSSHVAFSTFADAVSASKTLKHLDLRNNRLTFDCAASLEKLLIHNTVLISLDLRWNRLSTRGGDLIASAVAKNTVITSIQLTGNDIDYATLIAIDAKTSGNDKMKQNHSEVATLYKQQQEYQEVMIQNAERLQKEVEQRESTMATERRKTSSLIEQNEQLTATQHQLKAELIIAREQAERATSESSAKLHDVNLASTANLAETVEKHDIEMRKLSTANKELESTNSTLTGEIAHLRHQLEGFESGKADLLKRLEHGELENTSLSQTVATLREEAKELIFKSNQDRILLRRTTDELEAKTQTNTVVQSRKAELEDKILELERERNTMTAQLQRVDLEHERAVQSMREDLIKEKKDESEKAARRLREAQDEVAAREKTINELTAEAVRAVERHQTAIDDIEERHKKAKDTHSSMEIDYHRMSGYIVQLEAERKRTDQEARSAEDRRETLVAEIETMQRQHQADIDRLTERFASDRLELERKLLQKEERLNHLDTENNDLSQKLKRATEDHTREKDRLLRRVTEQVRVIFDES